MQADEIIAQARELDPSFTPQRHPNRVALHRLSRLQRRLVAELAKLDRRAIASEFEVALPLTDFDAGVPLEDGESVPAPIEMTAIHRPLDLWMKRDRRPRRLDLVTWADRHRVEWPAVWIREGRLYLSGTAEEWRDAERIVLTYTPTPAAVTHPDDELLLPLSAEDVLVLQLGAFFASRSNTQELARPRADYQFDAGQAEASWLDEIRRRRGATSSRTREVW